jgi:hypothetical protein
MLPRVLFHPDQFDCQGGTERFGDSFHLRLAPSFRRADGLLIVVEMNDSLNLIFVIDKANVTAYGHISVLRRRRGQAAPEVGRRAMHFGSHILVQYRSFMQARFFIGGKPILIPQTDRGIRLVLSIPVVCHLLIVLVKLRVALGKGRAAR